MTLGEALRETGKARRQSWGSDEDDASDCASMTGDTHQLTTWDAIATDWLPYHDPPKAPKIVCVHFCSPDHGPATRLYEHPGPPCPIPNDPPKEKRLREWWVCHNIKSPPYQPVALSTPPLGGGDADDGFTRVREVSPERDEIVRAAVAWHENRYEDDEVGGGVRLARLGLAVGVWKRAGRPA